MGSTKRRRGLVENLVVPVASAAVVTTAAVKSLRHQNGHGNGEKAPAQEPAVQATAQSQPELDGLDGAIARRLPFLRVPLKVKKRYGEVGGDHVAASFTLQAFLSLFPLMLVAIAVVGFVAAGDTNLSQRIVDSMGLSGDAAKAVTDALQAAKDSRQAASILGLVGLLWSGLGLVGAMQHAFNTVWQVRERGIKDKAVGLFWLAGASLLFVASAAITTTLRWLPGFLAPAGILVTFGISFVLWLWTSKVLPSREIPLRNLVPGALFGAAGLEILKFLGAYMVPRMVASSSQLYGSLGIVFAVLAWLLIFGRLIVYSAALNVVLYEQHEGTVKAVVEAPPVPNARPDLEADRSGRLVAT